MIKTLIAACAATLMLATLPAYAGAPINVCATKDGVLRLSASAACKAGEKLMRFAEWQPDAPAAAKDKPDTGRPAASDRTLDDLGGLQSAEFAVFRQAPHHQSLEHFVAQSTAPRKVDSQAQTDSARIDALEAKVAALNSRMTDRDALTVILNGFGKDIQALTKRVDTVEAAKEAPPPAAPPPVPVPAPSNAIPSRVRAPFEVISSTGQVILRVSEKENSEAGKGAHVSIGPGDGGNYALRVYKNGAAFAAGIGESQQGAGAVVAYDANGAIAASMNGGDHTIALWNQNAIIAAIRTDSRQAGLVAVYSGAEPVAFLTRSSGLDGGNVTTRLNNGSGVFSAGASRNGAGEACVNRKTQAGTPRLACLGLGLPSAGMGK